MDMIDLTSDDEDVTNRESRTRTMASFPARADAEERGSVSTRKGGAGRKAAAQLWCLLYASSYRGDDKIRSQ